MPFQSKACGLELASVATRIIAGETLQQMGYATGLWPEPSRYAVKAPVFSWQKLSRVVDMALMPEMKSTGEVMGSDEDFPVALYKALLAAGLRVPRRGNVVLTVADRDKPDAMPLARDVVALGYNLYATWGTAHALRACAIPCLTSLDTARAVFQVMGNIKEGEHFTVAPLQEWELGRV